MNTLRNWLILMGILSLLFGCGKDPAYKKKSGKWQYQGETINPAREPVNFQPIDDYFAKDDKVAYYRGTPIADEVRSSDAATFQVLNKYYAKDKATVYFCDTERDSKEYWSVRRNVIKNIRDADPATFRLLGQTGLARDKRYLFRANKAIQVRDLDSFTVLDGGFAKDKVRGYYLDTEIKDSDGASFTALGANYAKDKQAVYYVDGIVIGGTIKDVDLASFTPLDNGYARDRAKVYYHGIAINDQDAPALTVLPMGYAKTGKQVFHNGKLLADADAASFSVMEKPSDSVDASDKAGKFAYGKRIK